MRSSWHAVANIGSGSITIATLTATSATGTFSFVLAPTSGIGASRTITNGTFNVRF